jgi:SAM-dependent methyltransferase
MERQYRLMYRLGLTPWDQPEPPTALRRLVEGPGAIRAGVALDIGCGTGGHASYLAEQGWDVTAVDVARRAIDQARARSGLVHWHAADIAGRSATPVFATLAGRASLVLDVGCLHGLNDVGRRRWAEVVNFVAAPGARVLVWAVPRRGSRTLGPPGLDPDELQATLWSHWTAQTMDSVDPSWRLFEN